MAIAIDQATIGSMRDEVSRSAYTLTTTATVSSSAFVVLAIHTLDNPTSITSITNTGTALSWTVDKNAAAGGNRIAIASAQAPSGLASGAVITVNMSSSSVFCIMGGCSFTGVKTSSPVDGTPLGPTTASSVQPWSTGNYTVVAGSVIVGYCENSTNGSANTPTAPSVEVWELAGSGNDYAGVQQYRIESSAGSVPVAGSWGTACNSGNIAVAYLAAVGGTSSVLTADYGMGMGRW
jgi:hypothetical protein